MLLIFLQAKIGQKFENAGQIWGKDRAKIEELYSANGKNGASRLGVYNTYIPQTGNAHLCPEWSPKTDLCPHLCSRAKMRAKIFAHEEK